MSSMASQITCVSSVCSTVCWGADQGKHQSPTSLAFVRGINRAMVNSPHNGPVTWKMFPFDDIIMMIIRCVYNVKKIVPLLTPSGQHLTFDTLYRVWPKQWLLTGQLLRPISVFDDIHSLKATNFEVKIIISLWDSTSILTAVLPRRFYMLNVNVDLYPFSFTDPDMSTVFTVHSLHIEAETKLPPFRRRHFQMYFCGRECINFGF